MLLLLSGCASTPMSDAMLGQHPHAFEQPVELVDTPFFPQDQYQCGPATLATVLNAAGVIVQPGDLTPKIYIPGKRGSLQIEMLAATRRYGRLPYLLEPSLDDVLMQVVSGKPVVVFQNLGLSWIPQWHFAVVIGFDLRDEKLILRSGDTRRYMVNIRTFERTWQRAGRWAYIVLQPGEIPDGVGELEYFRAVASSESGLDPASLKVAYKAGVERWPDSRLLAMGIGNLYFRSGQYREAGHWFTRVVHGYPEYAPAHNNLAQVLMEQGDYEKALYHADRAIALGGNHRATYETTRDEILMRRAHSKTM